MANKFDLEDIGQIVVVDDKEEEATPIIRAFSRIGVPSLYFESAAAGIPENILKPEIVFLDLVFATAQGEQTVISMVHGALKRIIGSRRLPYILVLWSARNGVFADSVIASLDKETEFEKPVKAVCLEKGDYFTSLVDDGSMEITEEKLEQLRDDLSTEMRELNIISVFWQWSKIVSDAATSLIGRLIPSKNSSDDEWLGDLKSRIAEMAVTDLRDLRDVNEDQLVHNVWHTMSRSIGDLVLSGSAEKDPRVMELFEGESGEKYLTIASCKTEENSECRYVLYETGKKLELRKGDFAGKDDCYRKSLIRKHHNNISLIKSGLYLKSNSVDYFMPGTICDIDEDSPPTQDNLDDIAHIFGCELSAKDIRPYWLELTPLCDYANGKWEELFFLRAYLIEKDGLKNPRQDYLYCINDLYFAIGNSRYYLAVDYRHRKVLPVTSKKPKEVKCVINETLLADIRFGFTKYIGRLGI